MPIITTGVTTCSVNMTAPSQVRMHGAAECSGLPSFRSGATYHITGSYSNPGREQPSTGRISPSRARRFPRRKRADGQPRGHCTFRRSPSILTADVIARESAGQRAVRKSRLGDGDVPFSARPGNALQPPLPGIWTGDQPGSTSRSYHRAVSHAPPSRETTAIRAITHEDGLALLMNPYLQGSLSTWATTDLARRLPPKATEDHRHGICLYLAYYLLACMFAPVAFEEPATS